jgi:signal recognition particle receptor subunit beta
VVYYGPGLCGKTTNLHWIYNRTAASSRGEMVSLETEADRTLFFDLLPLDIGQISGFATRIQLYTVPGQVFYNTTRKLVLKGVDGVVFVADSQRAMQQANAESFVNLRDNLAEMGLAVESIPLVLQYNKRDLPEILSIEELQRGINWGGWPAYEAAAIRGEGVFETLKGISKLTLLALRKRLSRTGEAAGAESLRPPLRPPAAPKLVPPPLAPPPAVPPAGLGSSGGGGAANGSAPAPRRVPRTVAEVEGELDRLRHESLAAASPALRPRERRNGSGEINRSIELTLKRADYERARRFTLSLQVEDADQRLVDAARDLSVEFDDPRKLEKVLLRLKIALQADE